MITNSCNCFTVGFCPNEEFQVTDITISCPLPHIILERDSYSKENKYLPFEKEVLCKYKSIIKNVDKKVTINKYMLSRKSVDSNHYEAIKKCQQLIDLKPLKFTDYSNLHSLLIIHGRLLKNIKKSGENNKITVCENCSAFMEENCIHAFCEKYNILRNITKELERKVEHFENLSK